MTTIGTLLILFGLAAIVTHHRPFGRSRRQLLQRLKEIDYVLFLELNAGEQLSSDLMTTGSLVTTYIARKKFSNHADAEIKRIGQNAYRALCFEVGGFFSGMAGLVLLSAARAS
jgi:hypothetical protein